MRWDFEMVWKSGRSLLQIQTCTEGIGMEDGWE